MSPARITLQEAVPNPESLRWKMGEAYYASCGIGAWTGGFVPFRATSSFPVARQHGLVAARLLIDLTASGALAPDEDLVVLEVGSGLGMFAQNFFRALRASCGEAGRRLRRRVRYVMSDYGEPSVRQAAARPELAPLVAEGVLVPALFDLRRPDELWDVDRRPLALQPAMVVANYICDVCPPTVIRKMPDLYLEQYVALHVDAADPEGSVVAQGGEALLAQYFEDPVASPLHQYLQTLTEWRPVRLDERFPGAGGLHARVVAAALERFPVGTLEYPTAFVELLVGLAPRMKPGGLAMVSDYGSCDVEDFEGAHEPQPQRYGNSLAHGVNFALFDVLAAELGWTALRTRNPFRTVHTAALRFTREVSGGFRNAFHRAFKRREPGEDLFDFRDAGKACFERGDYRTAARFYRRVLRIDDSAQNLYSLGEACLEGGFTRAAYRYLRRGYQRAADEHDFDFLLGRACAVLGRFDEAIKWYEVSLAREVHPVTLTNLALIRRTRGELQQALPLVERALELQPDYEPAARLMLDIRSAWTG